MRITLLSIIGLLLCGSCTVSSKIITVKVGSEPEEYKQQMVYSLPQTLFKVNVELEKESSIPGPYYIYAEHFLGIKDVISRPAISYKIKNVSVESFSEPDPDQFYSVNTIKGSFNASELFALSKYGYILNPDSFGGLEYGAKREEMKNDDVFKYQNLLLGENLKTVTDTLYKTIITDSSFIQIPVVRSQKVAKNMEQKAEEAAKLIVKIRNKKFWLLSGTNDYMPDGQALDIAVKELNKMERNYIESFTGKLIKESTTYSFIVVPEADKKSHQYQLSFFSVQSGMNKDAGKGLPVVLEINPLNKIEQIESINTKGLNTDSFNSFYYRIPDIAEIRVLLDDFELYKSRQSLWQTGAIVSVPLAEK